MPLPRFRDVKIAQPQPANMLLRAREDERRTQNALQNRRRVDMRGDELGLRKEQFGYNKGMRDKEFKLSEEEHQFNVRKGKILEAAHYLPSVTQGNYGDWVKFQEENGLHVGSFKSPEQVLGMTPEEFEGYRTQLNQNAQSLRDMDYLKAKTQAEKDLESQKQGNRIKVREKEAELSKETPGKPQTNADKLNQLKLEAFEAHENGTATPQQIKRYGLDKDVYLGMAYKFVEDAIKNFVDGYENLSPTEKVKKVTEHATELRRAGTGQNKKLDPAGLGDVDIGIKDLLFK